MLLALILAAGPPAPDYAAHIRARRQEYGEGVADLAVVVEPPFVVWGDEGPVQVQRAAERVVRWTVKRLEQQFFAKRPAEIYDIFLFKDAASYQRHAKELWNETPSTPFGYSCAEHRALVMNFATGGGTLVHEMVHPYVAANFQRPPTWFNEGLASLFEQCEDREGQMVGLTNWRLEGLQAALERGPLPRFAKLVATTDAAFRDGDEALHYAQARYLMLFLQERGLLGAFVKRALSLQREDPTASRALRETLGEKRWGTLDADFAPWARKLVF